MSAGAWFCKMADAMSLSSLEELMPKTSITSCSEMISLPEQKEII